MNKPVDRDPETGDPSLPVAYDDPEPAPRPIDPDCQWPKTHCTCRDEAVPNG